MPFFLQGLKTGMYYLRTQPAAHAIQFTVDKSKAIKSTQANISETEEDDDYYQRKMACSMENKEACTMCSGWG